jgi:hypothetical protein
VDNFDKLLTPGKNRIAQITSATRANNQEQKMSDSNVSPNGQLSVPNWLAPVGAALGSLGLLMSQIFPPHTIMYKVSPFIMGLSAVLGNLSGGLRK